MLDFSHFWNVTESAAPPVDDLLTDPLSKGGPSDPLAKGGHSEPPTESTIVNKLNQIRASLDYLATRVEELERSLKKASDDDCVPSEMDVPNEGSCKQTLDNVSFPRDGTGDATQEQSQHSHWNYDFKHESSEGINAQDLQESRDYKPVKTQAEKYDETPKGAQKHEKFGDRIKDIDVKMLDVEGLDYDETNNPFAIFAPISNIFDELKRIFGKMNK